MLPSKIGENELSETLVSRLPLRPAARSKYRSAPMTGEQIREAFDRSAKLIAERVNQIIALLTETSSASGIAQLPYTEALTLGEVLEDFSALIEETKNDLSTFEGQTNQRIATLDVKTFGDITNLDAKITQIQENIRSLSYTLDQAKTDLEALESETDQKIANLDVKTFGDITNLDAKITQIQESIRSLSSAIDQVKSDIEKAEETQLEVATLSAELDALEEAHAHTAQLAENALPKQTKQGIYAHDYDSATGTLVDRVITYSPTASSTYKGSWRIAQRDVDGCLQAQPPTQDYQLTPKFYVEEHFRPKSQYKTITVSGRREITDWTEGEKVIFGEGGEPLPDETMKHCNFDDQFIEGERILFYCDQAGAFVTDVYHGEHAFSYDDASGMYVLHFQQIAMEFPEGSLVSCRVNAPIDARVFYDSRTVEDGTNFVVQPTHDYELSGYGIKRLFFHSPDRYRPGADGEVHIHFSTNTGSVRLMPAAPIYYVGDCCEDGQIKIIFGMRYNLSLYYDGLSIVCRVLAYPLPQQEESEEEI